MNKHALLMASTAAALGMTAMAQADSVTVFSQFPHTDDGFPSDGVPGQYWDQRVADDFTLVDNTVINGARWIGGSENFSTPDLDNFLAFVIEIFEDDNGAPGNSIFTTTSLVGATNPTFLGVDAVSEGNLYQHELEFSELALDAGTYYFSVGTVNLSPGDDGWVWNNAANTTNDLIFAEVGFGTGFGPAAGVGDFAFEIQAVPAPAGLAIFGLAGLARRRRRRA